MRFLRTVSTRRLLALIAGVVVTVGGGTAIALAASSSGPVPAPEPLATAVHDALGGAGGNQVKGITARISFTNHLIDSSSIQGVDPILSGATGRLWLAPGKMRLELQSDSGQDAQVVVSDGSFWIYDPASNTAYQGKLPSDGNRASGGKRASGADEVPSLAEIQADLQRLARSVNLSGATPGDVAGQGAYSVRVSPRHDGGMLGAAALAWDAVRGVPLRFAIYARGQSSPVIELKATDISYGSVPASNFTASPPSGAKIEKVTLPAGDHSATARMHGHHPVTGAAAVAKRLPFKLTAPDKLVGLPRRSVSLVSWGSTPAAVVTYGQNLGGIAVIEQAAKGGSNGQMQGGPAGGLNLPTVSINGATGHELDTALGSVVTFTRNGVSYTVLGSVPAAAADLAARAL